MSPATAKLTSKGQLTLPKPVRMRLGVATGDEVEFVEDQGRIVLRKHVVVSPFDRYVGLLEHLAGEVPDRLLDELRGEP